MYLEGGSAHDFVPKKPMGGKAATETEPGDPARDHKSATGPYPSGGIREGKKTQRTLLRDQVSGVISPTHWLGDPQQVISAAGQLI